MVRQELELELRPSVRRFAEAMERALRNHDEDRGPNGWAQDRPDSLFLRMEQEAGELKMAIDGIYSVPRFALDGQRRAIRAEAADVGNFAMMIFDVSRD